MAGHSKWKNIRFRKSKQDAAKGKIFTKMIREITVAAKQGADVGANPRLRLAVDKALGQNMTRDTIERAIKRGAGNADDSNFSEVRYEGYGAGGIAIIVDCMTDNRNRTVGEVRHAFTKHGGNLGTDGSVAYMFKQCGILCLPVGADENKVMEIALDAGAEDVTANDDGSIEVLTAPGDFMQVKDALEKAKLMPEIAEVSFIAHNKVAVDKETAEKIGRLLDVLEDLDDVQNVYSNAEFPDEMHE